MDQPKLAVNLKFTAKKKSPYLGFYLTIAEAWPYTGGRSQGLRANLQRRKDCANGRDGKSVPRKCRVEVEEY